MSLDIYGQQFHIRSSWRARSEEPDEIAVRAKRFLDTLGEIDETMRPWMVGGRRFVPYLSVRDDMAGFIRRRVIRREDRTVDRKEGYKILGYCSHPRQGYHLRGHAGGTYDTNGANEFSIGTQGGTEVDTTIVTYEVLKAVMLTLIACWEPASCSASSGRAIQNECRSERYVWMIYVPPTQVALVDLIGVPFSERIADDGLLLSATDQTYDMSDPAHAEGARLIEAATRNLREAP